MLIRLAKVWSLIPHNRTDCGLGRVKSKEGADVIALGFAEGFDCQEGHLERLSFDAVFLQALRTATQVVGLVFSCHFDLFEVVLHIT